MSLGRDSKQLYNWRGHLSACVSFEVIPARTEPTCKRHMAKVNALARLYW